MVKVEVLTDDFGTYKKGDVLEMHESTAEACVVHKKVKILKDKTEK
jgi:hypothetical protein